MIIVLNGPLGIGKPTLAEALMEGLKGSVMLDGDHIVAVNPPALDELAYLHATLSLLVRHHKDHGYRHFIINHLWRTAHELVELQHALRAVDADMELRCFLLTSPLEENLRRIRVRQSAKALDERAFEHDMVMEERAALLANADASPGEPFDVSAPPAELAATLLQRLGLR